MTHPFDTFYAAFGLKRAVTPRFWVVSARAPSIDDRLAAIRVEVIHLGHNLPDSLHLTCNYNTQKGLPGDGGVPFDIVAFEACPQENGTVLLSVLDTPHVNHSGTWREAAQHIPNLYRWAQALTLQVGGHERLKGRFILAPEMAEAA